MKPPCTERYARWCERTAVSHRLLLDFSSHCFGSRFEPEKIHGPGEKAGQHRKRDYHEKTGVRKLHKKYKDMIGWLEIKGTGFSYPVMQTGMKGHHPDDWQYYLHRDVHGGYSFYGTPFLDVRCRADSDNRIIYGHNINGRRYFGYLQNFREEVFFKKHPVFFFTPVDGKEEKYHIISVLETDKYADYYSFTGYGNEEDYYGMVDKILSHSRFENEAAKKMKKEMGESDAEAFFRRYRFVTLSTCRTMDGKDKRLMVIGCKKRHNDEKRKEEIGCTRN